ncbi:2-C-methyl-D-erythritol 4-phosphate cytidylyltransferase [Xylanibacillus composti]|uniref:2-C-methyl-D-erythritol 4-phosphate cytidylyltransferase n=1 Tax=Xylanibacillus composti TaxID=1572762 RepID=A0A8J4H7N7_9BACL|nr:2-C-methyl-D-erythritol 4-phosphate cytidylyltransferase [Xylanibacillus composti]MDT9727077.1 2-C-methyl-D-erythritol 4-phosphate cytidylyltransferase [Xylanibacillus composti]GIQ70343.1 2-C-methyl-D-erythritol 4-phosphate cytidylyltransferase [Xylanibacillus composti]
METAGAIIVAAGRGKRMGTTESKQFLPLAGKPVLVYALEAFERTGRFERIVVVTGEEDRERVCKLAAGCRLKTPIIVVAGGKERQHSVYAGLQAVDSDWVLVHDAARPFIEPAQIERCLSAAQERQAAAVLAVRVKDTIKVADEAGVITHTPNRDTLWAVQTPQAFRTVELREAHEHAAREGFVGTDDAMLMERAGKQVHIVEGSYSNIKLTTPDDWHWAEEHIRRYAERDSEIRVEENGAAETARQRKETDG